MKYYLGQRDAAHLWKCQPNNWLPRRVKMTFEQIFCKKVRDDKFLLGWNPRDGGRLVLSHLGISSLGRVDLFNDNDDQSCFLTAGLATWIFNGGYTSLYFEVTPKKLCEEKNISIIFQFGKHGILWSLLEFPLVFIPTDYITYWLHRSCLCQVFFVGFANHHPIHWHQTNQWTK